MPTRRGFEVALAVVILSHPVLGLARLWATKTLGSQSSGSIPYKIAEVITVIS